MKKELSIHILSTIVLFIPIFILKFFNFSHPINSLIFWPFWLGGLIGAILPDIDHVIYVYYLRPYEVTSQRVMYQAQKGNLMASWNLLASTRSERTNLILHTILFQVIFVVLSFWVVTSSPSIFGRGLVLAFLLHLLLDEVMDLRSIGNLTAWFRNLPVQFDQMQLNIYLITNFVIILIFGFLM